MELIEDIRQDGLVLATIIRSGFDAPGITFFTGDNLSQQVAQMHHPKGKLIEPHIHNAVKREVFYTQEVLVIRKGRVRVDFYSEVEKYVTSRVLGEWDLILLITGGHGFEVLEELQMYEIKQGPYAGGLDKRRFQSQLKSEDLRFE